MAAIEQEPSLHQIIQGTRRMEDLSIDRTKNQWSDAFPSTLLYEDGIKKEEVAENLDHIQMLNLAKVLQELRTPFMTREIYNLVKTPDSDPQS